MRLCAQFVLAMILFGLAGCSPPANRDTLVHEVLKADPGFAQVLEKYDEVHSRIETFKRELALKRSTIEHSIAQLRKELSAALLSARQKIEDAKKRMEPDHARLTLALSMASEELRTKRLQRSTLGHQMTELRKSLKGEGGAAWPPEERSRREAQINELLKDATRIDQESASLHEHIRLLKLKLLLIKL